MQRAGQGFNPVQRECGHDQGVLALILKLFGIDQSEADRASPVRSAGFEAVQTAHAAQEHGWRNIADGKGTAFQAIDQMFAEETCPAAKLENRSGDEIAAP